MTTKPTIENTTSAVIEVNFLLPLHTPDGISADEVIDKLEDTLIETTLMVSLVPQDYVYFSSVNGLVTEEGLSYTVVVEDTNIEVMRVKKLVTDTAKLLGQTFVYFKTNNSSNIQILKIE